MSFLAYKIIQIKMNWKLYCIRTKNVFKNKSCIIYYLNVTSAGYVNMQGTPNIRTPSNQKQLSNQNEIWSVTCFQTRQYDNDYGISY